MGGVNYFQVPSIKMKYFAENICKNAFRKCFAIPTLFYEKNFPSSYNIFITLHQY